MHKRFGAGEIVAARASLIGNRLRFDNFYREGAKARSLILQIMLNMNAKRNLRAIAPQR